MGIRVEHQPNPFVVGQAAVQAGQGQYMKWLAEQQQQERMQQASIEAQRARQAESIAAQQASQQAQFEYQSQRDQFNADQAAKSQAAQFEHQQGMAWDQQGAQFDRDIAQQNNARYMDDQNFEQKKQFEDYQYSAKQQAQLNDIETQRAWIDEQVAGGSWTPEDAQIANDQLTAKQMGINPRTPIKAPVPMSDFLKQNMSPVDGGGFAVRNPQTGQLTYIPAQKQPTEKGPDIQKLYGDAIKNLTTEDANGNTIQPTEEAIDSYIERAVRLSEKYSKAGSRGTPDLNAGGATGPAGPGSLPPGASQWPPQGADLERANAMGAGYPVPEAGPGMSPAPREAVPNAQEDIGVQAREAGLPPGVGAALQKIMPQAREQEPEEKREIVKMPPEQKQAADEIISSVLTRAAANPKELAYFRTPEGKAKLKAYAMKQVKYELPPIQKSDSPNDPGEAYLRGDVTGF